jgi:hypothetical protein
VISEADALGLADGKWVPIPRLSRTIPFGYEVSPDDPDVLLPVPIQLEALEQAKKHIKRFSYRDVANWITAVTGRSISHMGLKKRLDIERSRRNKAKVIESWANRLEKAKTRAETFRQERLGAKEEGGGT